LMVLQHTKIEMKKRKRCNRLRLKRLKNIFSKQKATF
jgi:hypothetical protein